MARSQSSEELIYELTLRHAEELDERVRRKEEEEEKQKGEAETKMLLWLQTQAAQSNHAQPSTSSRPIGVRPITPKQTPQRKGRQKGLKPGQKRIS